MFHVKLYDRVAKLEHIVGKPAPGTLSAGDLVWRLESLERSVMALYEYLGVYMHYECERWTVRPHPPAAELKPTNKKGAK